jgi:hypothetical protein
MRPTKTNILKVLDRATPSQYADGINWYRDAHNMCTYIGGLYNHETETVAGVIAALSPMLPWDRNVILAKNALRTGIATGCLTSNCAKANRIINGELPLEVLGGDKVTSFYLNIANPSNDRVTIDRHAYDIAVGHRNTENTRPSLKRKAYEQFVGAYRRASADRGLIPNQLQAITWVVWREQYAYTK